MSSEGIRALWGHAGKELWPHVDTWRSPMHPAGDMRQFMCALERRLEPRDPEDNPEGMVVCLPGWGFDARSARSTDAAVTPGAKARAACPGQTFVRS